jgi:hypothetical protein
MPEHCLHVQVIIDAILDRGVERDFHGRVLM